MNKKLNSFRNSRKLQVAAALATASFLSACAGAPAPCVEPTAEAPAKITPTAPATIPEQQDVAESALKAETAPQQAPAAQTASVPADCVCTSTPVEEPAAQAAKSDDPSRLEQSRQESSKAEPSKEESSTADSSRTDSSKVETSKTESPIVEPSKADTSRSEPSKVEQPASPSEAETPDLPAIVPAADTARTDSAEIAPAADSTAGGKLPPDSARTVESAIIPPDPYQEFPALASRVFAFADTLYKQGMIDSAVTYLQRFRVIKPLWNQWESTADSMLNEFGKTNAELAKQYEPLVLQIKNMNRVQTSYSIVAETADSLIALAPGDSLTRFANEQKQVAYSNTLKRAQKEMATIKAMVDQRAQFEEAEQRALDFQMRHRDFENDLKIQALIDYIRETAQAAGSEASKYWDKHDPAKAMEEASALIDGKKFAQAKELLTKLKASNLRKEAMEKYVELADAYCNAQRKETSQLFAKAQKQKNAEKKKALLQSAIAPLDKCIAEYPESTQIQKVQDNRKFLEKELEK
ncbi:MAG: hypothetical protein MJY87_08855 [Fibrobacter sp.]|nr:hypothetical protein [Fibrobacter sp.]